MTWRHAAIWIPGGISGSEPLGVVVLMALNYISFYSINFGYWGLGNPHMEHMTVT